MQIVCRKAVESDASRIAEFNSRLALETEQKVLDPSTVLQGVRHGLQLAPEVLYFVAEVNSEVIGQLMLTREWSDWRNGWMVWLQSVYVESSCRGHGVFRQLFESSIRQVRSEIPVVCVRLYVEHLNAAAKQCYQKLGFGPGGYEVLELAY